jgi:DNA-directed RNA polymerase specialized sigma54-like protein
VGCEPVEVSVGVYEFNIFFTRSLVEAQVGNELSISITATVSSIANDEKKKV